MLSSLADNFNVNYITRLTLKPFIFAVQVVDIAIRFHNAGAPIHVIVQAICSMFNRIIDLQYLG
jgi:hypothetical protein